MDGFDYYLANILFTFNLNRQFRLFQFYYLNFDPNMDENVTIDEKCFTGLVLYKHSICLGSQKIDGTATTTFRETQNSLCLSKKIISKITKKGARRVKVKKCVKREHLYIFDDFYDFGHNTKYPAKKIVPCN